MRSRREKMVGCDVTDALDVACGLCIVSRWAVRFI